MNYLTMMNCLGPRRVSQRIWQALEEFRDSQGGGDDGPGIVGDVAGEGTEETLELRVAALEQEIRELREMVDAQAEELAALRRQVAELEERSQPPSGAVAVDSDQRQAGE